MRELLNIIEDRTRIAREAVRTFVLVFVYASVVLLLASRVRWLAVALFWLGVASAAGVALFVARSHGGMPSGLAPKTRLAATIIRALELCFVLGVLYYLYIDLY